MSGIALVFALLGAVGLLATLAGRIGIPYPILLVFGGLALAFVPGLPRLVLEPEVIFLLFLPPLLFSAAYLTSWRDLRENGSIIGLLAVGLVLVTTVVVAAVAHLVAGLPWAAAFVLGAVVSPTDAIAATAIAQRLGVPRRIITVLEGESLVNDASGIVAYRIAAAVAAGTVTFSPVQASLQFVLGSIGGVLVGVGVGWLTVQITKALDDAPVETVVSLVAPFLAYITAEEGPHFVWHDLLGFPAEPFFSGVLSVMAAGLYVGRHLSRVMSSSSRLKLDAVWNVLIFLLNGLAFILIGLQLPEITDGLGNYSLSELALSAVVVSLAVIFVRALWVFATSYQPRVFIRSSRALESILEWRSVTVISWAGMRGVISLAAALALPLTTPDGSLFPGRDLILFLTFSVILATLVVQGLSLPLLIRKLGLRDDGLAEREETRARLEVAEAALSRLDELEPQAWVERESAQRVRERYLLRRRRFLAQSQALGGDGGDGQALEEGAHASQRLVLELVLAQRATLLRLRSENAISDEAFRGVERDLDLEEAQSRTEVD